MANHTIRVDFTPDQYDLLINLIQLQIEETKESPEDLVALKIALYKGKDFF